MHSARVRTDWTNQQQIDDGDEAECHSRLATDEIDCSHVSFLRRAGQKFRGNLCQKRA
jgi:hypothetical protein